MNYREFVKEHFHQLPAELPAKERMKKIAEMWRKSGHAKPKGGSVVGGKLTHKAKPMKSAKKTKGAGLIGDLFPPAQLLGLGMEKKHKKAKKEKGAGLIGSLFPPAQLLGLGMEKKAKGKGLLSSLFPPAGIFGLGLPDKVKHKHYTRMQKLEQKLANDGKLTPAQHHKLKVYHHLHGAGFFDNMFSGMKKAVGAIADNMDTIKKVVPEIAKLVPESAKAKLPTMVRTLAKI